MERDAAEVVMSQDKRPFAKFGNEENVKRQSESVKLWLARQDNMDVLLVDYNVLATNPQQTCKEIANFIYIPLDCSKMANIFDEKLYRNRVKK